MDLLDLTVLDLLDLTVVDLLDLTVLELLNLTLLDRLDLTLLNLLDRSAATGDRGDHQELNRSQTTKTSEPSRLKKVPARLS